MMLLRPFLLCCFAAPALAECPEAGDLATGIRATMDDGSFEDYFDLSPGLVEMVGNYDGYIARNLLGQGVYIIELVDLEDGNAIPDTRTTYSYPDNPAELPIPAPGSRWTVATAGRTVDGLFSENQSHVWGEMTRATYGSCSYDLLVGQFEYKGDGYSFKEEIHYLPALGIGLLAAFEEQGEGTDVFTYVSFEALEN